jgi:hypothetical protein
LQTANIAVSNKQLTGNMGNQEGKASMAQQKRPYADWEPSQKLGNFYFRATSAGKLV